MIWLMRTNKARRRDGAPDVWRFVCCGTYPDCYCARNRTVRMFVVATALSLLFLGFALTLLLLR